LTGHTSKVTALVFTGDNATLASVGDDHHVNFWDMKTGVARSVDKGPGSEVPVMNLSPDGKSVIAWTKSQLEFYDPATLKQGQTQTVSPGDVGALAFSADGAVAALALKKSGNVSIWDVVKKQPLPNGDFPAHQESIVDLMVTPDKKTLVTTDSKGNVKVWDLTQLGAAKPAKPPEAVKTWQAHKVPVSALAMSPDGKTFATASQDNIVKVWETATGKELRSFEFQVNRHFFIRNMTFTPNGKQLVTANHNTTSYLLDLP
jgi:WD40 repeat protein